MHLVGEATSPEGYMGGRVFGSRVLCERFQHATICFGLPKGEPQVLETPTRLTARSYHLDFSVIILGEPLQITTNILTFLAASGSVINKSTAAEVGAATPTPTPTPTTTTIIVAQQLLLLLLLLMLLQLLLLPVLLLRRRVMGYLPFFENPKISTPAWRFMLIFAQSQLHFSSCSYEPNACKWA